jgi:hypothetical protein
LGLSHSLSQDPNFWIGHCGGGEKNLEPSPLETLKQNFTIGKKSLAAVWRKGANYLDFPWYGCLVSV